MQKGHVIFIGTISHEMMLTYQKGAEILKV